MSDTTTEQDKPPDDKKKPSLGVVTYRASETHKKEAQQIAAWQGYDKYTNWIRDLVEAEIANPKHRPRPKPKEQKQA